MSKRYKCIKTYPGSPDLGTILHDKITGYGWRDEGPYCRYFYTNRKSIEESPEFWEEIKEPLFITEDGVEVFKEGNFFIIDTDYNQEGACYFAWSIEKLFIKNKSDLPVSSCVKIFSTEKAAKEYIDLNKPRFSKKDLLDASVNIQYGGWFIEGLIKKLNK